MPLLLLPGSHPGHFTSRTRRCGWETGLGRPSRGSFSCWWGSVLKTGFPLTRRMTLPLPPPCLPARSPCSAHGHHPEPHTKWRPGCRTHTQHPPGSRKQPKSWLSHILSEVNSGLDEGLPRTLCSSSEHQQPYGIFWEGTWILPHTLYHGLEKQNRSYLVNQKDVEGNHFPRQYSLV